MKNSISLCMIVRDEEQMLPRCLPSARGFVDEMVVVDTGSKDRTIEIAESFGAKVYHFPWEGDFAKARNFAIRMSSSPWVLIMDADDELVLEQCNKKNLLGAGFDLYACSIVNILGTPLFYQRLSHPQPRLFKKKAVTGYFGLIHEQLVYREGAKAGMAPFKIIHHGYTKEWVGSKEKGERNIQILTRQLGEEPENPFVRYNLAVERAQLGHVDEACLELESLFQKGTTVGEGLFPELVRKYVLNLITLELYDKALEVVTLGREFYPDYTDLVYSEARIHYLRGDWSKALFLFQLCLEMGESPPCYCTTIGVGSYLALAMIGEIYSAAGDFLPAVNNSVLALKHYQDDITPLLNLATAVARGKSAPDFFREFNLVCQIPEEYRGLIVQTLLERGEVEAAKSFFNGVATLGENHEYYHSLLEFAEENLLSSRSRLESLIETAAKDCLPSVAAQLCICCWVSGDWEGAQQYLPYLEEGTELSRVYNKIHCTLLGTEPERIEEIRQDDFKTLLHPVHQFLCYGKREPARKILNLMPLFNTDHIVRTGYMLLRFGLYKWAVDFIFEKARWDNAEISFLYGKALLGYEKPGPAAKIFETLIAGEPGFLPAHAGLILSYLSLAYNFRAPEVQEHFKRKLHHWLRTGYLS